MLELIRFIQQQVDLIREDDILVGDGLCRVGAALHMDIATLQLFAHSLTVDG